MYNETVNWQQLSMCLHGVGNTSPAVHQVHRYIVDIVHILVLREYGRPGLVRPRGMFRMWLYLAFKLRYGARKHIWKLLVTSLST